MYATRFDHDDPWRRASIFAQIAAAAALAVNVYQGLESAFPAFAWSYVALRALLVLGYRRAGIHVPAARPLTKRFILGFGGAALLWAAAALLPAPLRWPVWGLGVALDLLPPLLLGQLPRELAPHPMHLPERFGLLTLIVLGEAITAVVGGIAGHRWDAASAVAASLGLAFAFGLWWLYFDGVDSSMIRHAGKSNRTWLFHLWVYAHLPLAIGTAAFGTGVQRLIVAGGTLAGNPAASGHLTAASAALCFTALAAIALLAHGTKPDLAQRVAACRMGAAGVVLVAPCLEDAIPTAATFAWATATCVAEALVERRLRTN